MSTRYSFSPGLRRDRAKQNLVSAQAARLPCLLHRDGAAVPALPATNALLVSNSGLPSPGKLSRRLVSSPGSARLSAALQPRGTDSSRSQSRRCRAPRRGVSGLLPEPRSEERSHSWVTLAAGATRCRRDPTGPPPPHTHTLLQPNPNAEGSPVAPQHLQPSV